MKNYTLIVKSHCDMPDYEREFTADQLKVRMCAMEWAWDYDETGSFTGADLCGGHLTELENGDLKCDYCGVTYGLIREGGE